MESQKAKFFENKLISMSDQMRNLGSENDHLDTQAPTSSDKLVVIHALPE